MKWERVGQGSYTVEATFLVPFLLFVIYALCYLTFYLHDKIVVETQMNRMFREVELWEGFELDEEGGIAYADLCRRDPYAAAKKEEREEEGRLAWELARTLKGKLVNLELESCKVEIQGGRVRIEVVGKKAISIRVVERWLWSGRLRFEGEKDGFHPCESVRRWETATEWITR